jgi:predicted phosphoribosyltransferase
MRSAIAGLVDDDPRVDEHGRMNRPLEPAPFANRTEAGRSLGAALESFRDARPVVLGMARGGVPVAAEAAKHLQAPLDVLVVRKVGAPGHPEFAIGALTTGILRIDEMTVQRLGVTRYEIDEIVTEETRELARREAAYRQGRAPIAVGARTVIVVDDGLATGLSARVAVDAIRRLGPSRVVFAAPVCAPGAAERLGLPPEDIRCVMVPEDFYAVGAYYQDFRQTSDAEVIALLAEADRRLSGPGTV